MENETIEKRAGMGENGTKSKLIERKIRVKKNV